MGTAWLVIVARRMLTGGVGSASGSGTRWNNLNVRHILIAIAVIGVVGLLLNVCWSPGASADEHWSEGALNR